ncbi:MAG: hypothetical protein DMG58_20250 [Acidobacteria bacterium]|nr:MAG: hypothetical protein DMG58_20250 [Acidobacteriota bacterium]
MKRTLFTLSLMAMTCAAMFAQITSSDSVAAVPEPGSLILLSTVAAGVGFAAYRRSRNK